VNSATNNDTNRDTLVRASTGALNTSTGLPRGSARIASMAVNAELFEKRYIDRDSVLLDSACFNHLFNSKKWFIEYMDTESLSTAASNGGTGIVIGRGTVQLSVLLPDGSPFTIELENCMYQPSVPCNLISTGQLERGGVIQNGFDRSLQFKSSRQVIGSYSTINSVFVVQMDSSKTTAQPAFASI
jgi:hypothetical protein